jgi:signal transduction histidine kinase
MEATIANTPSGSENAPGDSPSRQQAEELLMLSATAADGAPTGQPPGVALERERIARELNRYTIHRLFGIGLKLQSLAVSGPDSATPRHIDDCVRELDLAIVDLRKLIFELGPRNV